MATEGFAMPAAPPRGERADGEALRRALFAVRDLRARLSAAEAARQEPIAVVGLGCRFPGGADGPEAFWRLLSGGVDAVGEVPADRWPIDDLYDPDPDAPGKMSSRWGAFLDGVDRFDAELFGIAPREAAAIDPQQRLLLEVAWEALEHGGLAADRWFGEAVGVFVGISTNDYGALLGRGQGDLAWVDSYASLGNALSVASGRLSYAFGFTGPALSIDTACSSSLVAVHLAMKSLRDGECPLALAAGVNLMLSPELSINFSKARMMAADGRCKTFDAAADGYVRGEGCGVLVLRRLSDAQAAGDRVLAVLRGSAVNQDGHSSGLTAPSGPAQERVLRAALAAAGVTPADVSYLEAHGTGTALGDPIEVGAIRRVFAPERPAGRRLALGSVKTNLGHLESAAGVAGLIKTVLALGHRELPPHLHFREWNPEIAADGAPGLLEVPRTLQPWASIDGAPRIAGVSSFGFSGTNAHVVVAEAPAPEPAEEPTTAAPPERSHHLLVLSARDAAALGELAGRWSAHLATASDPFPDLCATAAQGRTALRRRLAVVAADADEARPALDDAVAGATTAADGTRVAFLFAGQGTELAAGGELWEASPAFRAAVERHDATLRPLLGRPLPDLLWGGEDVDPATLQPALVAFELALAATWAAWGVRPAAVLGHSLGELAAAAVAGVLDEADALRLAALRGRAMAALPPGAMAAVFAGADAVRKALAGDEEVEVAAENGPHETVVSGPPESLAAARERLAAAGLESRRLPVTQAFHSRAVDAVVGPLGEAAAGIAHRAPRLVLVSAVDGAVATSLAPDHWAVHARRPVRFAAGLATLRARGFDLFLEIGPRAVLAALGEAADPAATWVPSLRRGRPEVPALLAALGRLWTAGAEVDWQGFEEGRPRRRPTAPTYPFQRRRHWLPTAPSTAPAAGPAGHPLLGRRIATPVATALWSGRLDPARLRFLAEHRVLGELVVPGASHLVTALLAGREERGAVDFAGVAVAGAVFAEPLTLPEGGIETQLVLRDDGDGLAFELHSRDASDDDAGAGWRRHATGRLIAAPPVAAGGGTPEAIAARCRRDEAGPAALHAMLAERGIELGESFRGAAVIWRGDGEALVEVRRPESLAEDAAVYPLHPALLDACFQSLGAASAAGEGDAEASFLPLSVDRLALPGPFGETFWCHARLRPAGPSRDVAMGDLRLVGAGGELLGVVEGLQVKRVDPAALAPKRGRDSDAAFHAVTWPPAPLPEARAVDPAAVATAAREMAVRLHAELDLESLAPVAAGLEALATESVVAGLAALGWTPRPGDEVAVADLAERLGVAPAHRELLARWCRDLAADDVLEPAGPGDGSDDAYRVRSELSAADPEARHAALVAAHPAARLEVDLVARCGRALPDVLRGTADPLALLFAPGESGDSDDAGDQNVYRDSPFARYLNGVVGEVVARAAGDGPVRVLEVGAGTGATTAAVLPRLPAGSSYLFTDVAPGLVAAARRRFAGAEGMDFARLDLEAEPEAQGLATESFDLVLAANVLHATADLAATLGRLRRLLAPGGALVLLEASARRRWSDLVFGTTPGWWRFTDRDLRPDHPLLDPPAWRRLLVEAGFADPVSVLADDEDQAVIVAGRRLASVRWRLAGGSDEAAAAVAAALAARGQEAVRGGEITDDDRAGVVDLGGLVAVPPVERVGGVLERLQAMATAGRRRLVVVTRGAVAAAADGDDDVTDPEAATLWGLARVARLEHPELACRSVDLDPARSVAEQADVLARELLAADGESEVAWRDGERRAARIASAAPPVADEARIELRGDGAYLVTGGLGGLGLALARWLARRGARHLVLAGRSALSYAMREAAREAIAALAADDVRVDVVTLDVADRDAVAALLAGLATPLRGVFHLAGALDDGILLQQTRDRFATVFAAKVDGARHLHELTADLELDHFVLFSSSAAVFGNRGQANHAAANAYLGALAHHRRARGLPALTVDWGGWGDVGAVAERGAGERFARQGTGLLSVEEGLAALERALLAGTTQVAVVPIRWPAFLRAYGGDVPRFFAGVAGEDRPRPAAGAGAGPAAGDLLAKLQAAPPAARRRLLGEGVTALVARVLGVPADRAIDADEPLSELGLDSLMALELRGALGRALGLELPATLLFNYPTTGALADHLAGQLRLDRAPAAASRAAAAAEAETSAAELAAVEGLSEDEMAALIDRELGELWEDDPA